MSRPTLHWKEPPKPENGEPARKEWPVAKTETPAPAYEPEPEPASVKPVFQRSGVIRKRRIAGSDPVYPGIARQARKEATLVVKITITPEGRVGEYRFLKTNETFEQAVIDALQSWRFSPHLVNGNPVSTYTLYKFVFKLD